MRVSIFAVVALIGTVLMSARILGQDNPSRAQSELAFALIGDMPYNDATHDREPSFSISSPRSTPIHRSGS